MHTYYDFEHYDRSPLNPVKRHLRCPDELGTAIDAEWYGRDTRLEDDLLRQEQWIDGDRPAQPFRTALDRCVILVDWEQTTVKVVAPGKEPQAKTYRDGRETFAAVARIRAWAEALGLRPDQCRAHLPA